MAIKLITFDLDNTLWENDSVIQRAEQVCYNFLIKKSPVVAAHYSLEDLKKLRFSLMKEKPHLSAQVSKVRKLSLQTVLESVQHPQHDIQQTISDCFDCFLEERNNVSLFPETVPLLETLSRQYQLASLTNGNSDLKKIGIDHYFSFFLSAEKVGASKPRPNIFHAALQKASVEPHEVIHIGDHPEDDVYGAQQLGFHTVWFNPKNLKWDDKNGKFPSGIVTNLLEIPEKILNITS